MKIYNILVFPCGTEIANEIINSLKNHKYFKVKYASSEEISYCNFREGKVNILPYVGSENFVYELNDLIVSEKIDFVIPAHDDVAYELSMIEEEVKASIIGQSKEINQIVRFKDQTYIHFKDLLPIARFNIDKPNENDFPIYAKPKKGQGSQDCFKIESKDDFCFFLQNHDIDKYVVMEYLSGDEFTIDCFSHNGNVLYFGARSREKVTKGISVLSTFITDKSLVDEFYKYATNISSSLNMHGVWFFQMKYNLQGELKLLEVGSRISGTMMLNRARGINFVELAIYQKLGYDIDIVYNDVNISLARALIPIYKHNFEFDTLYVDFDDTLFIDEKYLNPDIMKLIFIMKNENKNIILITKNSKNNLDYVLCKFGISQVFDEIIHLSKNDKKIDYMKQSSLLVDDSFQERKEAILNNLYAIGVDNVSIFFKY